MIEIKSNFKLNGKIVGRNKYLGKGKRKSEGRGESNCKGTLLALKMRVKSIGNQ